MGYAEDLSKAREANERAVCSDGYIRLPHREDRAALIEKGARALVWHRYSGCVSWEDTNDPETTGDEQTRGYARLHAEAVLVAVGLLPEEEK